ncbi:retrotransposon protein, putative, ty1-copia subclass [Tanacetum coccineum]
MGYSFYYPPENKVLVARNAEFLENSLITQEASGSLEDLEIIQEEDTHPSIDTSLNHEEDDLEIDEPQSDIIPIRRSTRTRHAPNRMCLYIDAEEHELGDLGEPANYKAALLDPNKTVGSKWLFKKKTDMDGAVHTYKARLVAKGYTQTPGIDYEETFSPVADIRAIRILIAIAAYYDYEIWQMDVKTAFLNGYLNEEVYMEQPEGFVNPKYPNRVCKLKRSIYGLKQASRQWNKRFDDEIKKFGFSQNADEPFSELICVVLNGGCVIGRVPSNSIFATIICGSLSILCFDASKEAVWVRKFIYGLGVVPTIEKPINMYCDNTGAIAIANESGITKEKVHTDDNLADPFTKALAFPKHSELTRNIGMLPASSLISPSIQKLILSVYHGYRRIGHDVFEEEMVIISYEATWLRFSISIYVSIFPETFSGQGSVSLLLISMDMLLILFFTERDQRKYKDLDLSNLSMFLKLEDWWVIYVRYVWSLKKLQALRHDCGQAPLNGRNIRNSKSDDRHLGGFKEPNVRPTNGNKETRNNSFAFVLKSNQPNNLSSSNLLIHDSFCSLCLLGTTKRSSNCRLLGYFDFLSILEPPQDKISEDPFGIYNILNKQDNKEAGQDSDPSHPPGFTQEDQIMVVIENLVEVGQTMGCNRAGCKKNIENIVASSWRIQWSINEVMSLNIQVIGNQQETGGILCVWDPNSFAKDNATISDYFVAVRGTWLSTATKVMFVSIYAPQDISEKKSLWEYITHIIDTWDGECIILGDFNEVRSKQERIFVYLGYQTAKKMSKLDRFLISEGLLLKFPSLSAICLDRHLSDHRPIIMREVVTDLWHPFRVLSILVSQERHLMISIKEWCKDDIKRSNDTCFSIKARLSDLDKLFDNGLSNEELVTERISLLKELHNFYKKVTLSLWPESKVDDLKCDVTFDEIKKAVWDCETNKSPGPDGFSFDFIRTFWDILKQDFVNAIREFFISSKFPPGCNSSFIALIPKKHDAKFVKDYRPISLIGCFYKIVSKILANRLKMVISELISDVQSAFGLQNQYSSRVQPHGHWSSLRGSFAAAKLLGVLLFPLRFLSWCQGWEVSYLGEKAWDEISVRFPVIPFGIVSMKEATILCRKKKSRGMGGRREDSPSLVELVGSTISLSPSNDRWAWLLDLW